MTLRLAWLALPVLLTAFGCGKNGSEPTSEGPKEPQSAPASPTLAVQAGQKKPATTLEWFHQPFAEATRTDAPEGWQPPEKTMASRSVGKLYEDVVARWERIRFVTEDGRKIHYSARIETALGTIELSLDPEKAPNHVRNFIALAEAGYYDGLTFDTIQHDDQNLEFLGRYEEIEAGCPVGTGDPTRNSIGYWLKPELSEGSQHQEGTVGACPSITRDATACKFYICLGSAPHLDGQRTIFGRVTSGLGVARKIFLRPVVLTEEDEGAARRPVEPVVIRKVTIHKHEQ